MPEKRLDMTSIVALLVVAVAGLGTLSLLATVGVLDSNDAADWVTAVGTVALVIVAAVALWPAARQVKQAARASAESHRPYVSLGTRVSVKGHLYLDLINHGNRAALEVTAHLSKAPPHDPDSGLEPFGNVSYLSPGERRSILYAGHQDRGRLPESLVIEITYTGEDGESHTATITHDIEALGGILINPDDIGTS